MCEVCEGYSNDKCPVCGGGAKMITCPDCKGTGEGNWKVFDVVSRMEVSCPELAYELAPDTEDQAIELGKRFCRVSNTCQTCKGVGEIAE